MSTPPTDSKMLLLSEIDSRLRILELLIDAKSIGEALIQAEKEEILADSSKTSSSTASDALPLMTHIPQDLLSTGGQAPQTTLLMQLTKIEHEVASIVSRYPELTQLAENVFGFNDIYGLLEETPNDSLRKCTPERLLMMKELVLSSLDDMAVLRQRLASVSEKAHIIENVSRLLVDVDVDALMKNAIARRNALDAQLRAAATLQHTLDDVAAQYAQQVQDANAKIISWSATIDALEKQ